MMENFWHLMLKLTGGIYNIICYIYDIFYFLCDFKLFDNDVYAEIVNNIYIVLGLIMTFVLAYSLLKAVINPDDFAKGEASFPKLIKNVVVSLVIIVILPTVFNVAFSIQNALLNNNVIPKLILGDSSEYAERDENNNLNIIIDESTGSVSGGRYIASEMFKAFLYPNEESGVCGDSVECRDKIKNDTSWYDFWTEEKTLEEVDKLILDGESFDNYSVFAKSVKKGNISFDFIFAVAGGIFVAYVLLNFCFDMALRVVKLAFYQLIAPIPVICRIIPGGKLKDVFSKWMKQVISLFIEVFIRIGALTLGVYLISLVGKNLNLSTNSAILNSLGQKTIVKALLIMAIIMFVKQIPKLLGDLFGLDTGGMKLGLMDKLAAGGALAAGATLGGLAGTVGRNAVAAGRNIRNADGWKNKLKSGVLGVASIGAGGLSGAARGFKAGKGAKNFGDVKKASGSAVAGATQAREKRDAYRAAHKGKNALGTGLNVAWGHITDTYDSVKEYMGVNSIEGLKAEKEAAATMQGFYKEMAGFVEDNEMVANYAGLYEAERKREINRTISSFDNKRYMDAINSRVKILSNDARYAGLSQNELYNIAGSEISKAQFTSTREMTGVEYANAIQERQDNLKKYENLKKIAIIKAINEKLNDKDGSGKIIDGRFAAVANKVEVFKKQNATYDFVQNMNSIEGVNWDASWDSIMKSDDFKQIDNLLSDFKKGKNSLKFFADSEIGKNRVGDVDAKIAEKIFKEKQEKK